VLENKITVAPWRSSSEMGILITLGLTLKLRDGTLLYQACSSQPRLCHNEHASCDIRKPTPRFPLEEFSSLEWPIYTTKTQ
jgi:hypothetical protein